MTRSAMGYGNGFGCLKVIALRWRTTTLSHGNMDTRRDLRLFFIISDFGAMRFFQD